MSINKRLLTAAIATAVLSTSEGLMAAVLEEIVVTAQRKEESLLEVPVAVSSYSAESLRAASVDDISDLNAANPSSMATPFLSDPLGNAPVRIRGIGTGGGNPGFEGAVGLYVDEVYRSRTGSALLTFFDMAGVEILRGPQGTLFGKNTTAGALLQRTAAPVLEETSASVSGELGNYGQEMIEGYVNLPVSDTVAVRIAGLVDNQDGWFEHPVNGEETFWRDTTAIRASVAFEPGDSFSGRVTLDWSSMESPGNYGTSTRLNNQDNEGNDGRQALFASMALNQGPWAGTGGADYWYWDPATGEGVDPFTHDIAPSRNGEYELEQTGITLSFSWDLNDSMELRSITGYREIDSESLNGDWDFGPTALAGALNQVYDFDTFSHEFLLSGDFEVNGDQSIEYVTGVNYYTEDIGYLRQATVGSQFAGYLGGAWNGAFAPLGGGIAEFGSCTLGSSFFCQSITSIGNTDFMFQDVLFDQKEDSVGVFGHVTYNLTHQTSLILGARYNKIEKEIETDNRVGADQDEYHDLVLANQLGFYLAGAALMSPDWSETRKDEEWTYAATLQYRPTDSMQLYASYSRGFKSGGFNMNEDAVGGTPNLSGTPDTNGRLFSAFTPETATFDPEYVDAYELGMKTDIGESARLFLTIFRSEYDDLQVASFTGFNFVVYNAGTSTTEGIEIETEWAVTDNLTLTAGGTFMKAEYGDDVVGLPAGRRRGQTPDEAVTLGARYVQPLSEDRELYVNANYSYAAEMFLAEGTGEPLRSLTQDAYNIVNATFGLRAVDDWDVSLFCNNCFDEEYFEWAFNQPFHDAIMVNSAPPMTYGVRLVKDF